MTQYLAIVGCPRLVQFVNRLHDPLTICVIKTDNCQKKATMFGQLLRERGE